MMLFKSWERFFDRWGNSAKSGQAKLVIEAFRLLINLITLAGAVAMIYYMIRGWLA